MTTHRLLPIVLSLVLCAAVPARAEDEDGFSLMDEGARMILRGLMAELEPTFDELEGAARALEPQLRAFAEQMGPALGEFMLRIDDLANYEAPEFLDNGDILIRRRADAPPFRTPETPPDDDDGPDEAPEAPAVIPDPPIDL